VTSDCTTFFFFNPCSICFKPMRIGRDRKDQIFYDFSYQFALCISLEDMKLFSSELTNEEKVLITAIPSPFICFNSVHLFISLTICEHM
jgi:hypothetical protein